MGQEVTEPTARPLSWPYSTNWSRPPLASSLWFTALAVSPSLAPTKGPPLMGQSQEAVGGVTWPGTMPSGQGHMDLPPSLLVSTLERSRIFPGHRESWASADDRPEQHVWLLRSLPASGPRLPSPLDIPFSPCCSSSGPPWTAPPLPRNPSSLAL